MKKLIRYIGYLFSFIFPQSVSSKIQGVMDSFYTGWKKRCFKSFHGHLNRFVHIKGGQYITVGENTLIEDSVRLFAFDRHENQSFSPEIVIGNHCVIQKNCFVSSINKVIIGDNTAITEHTLILDNTHGDFQDNHLTFSSNPEVPDVFLKNAYTRNLASKGPVIIENDVHVGMFCTILPGTVIGHHSVIAAHSVVSRKIPPYSIVAGNPAEVIITFGRKNKH